MILCIIEIYCNIFHKHIPNVFTVVQNNSICLVIALFVNSILQVALCERNIRTPEQQYNMYQEPLHVFRSSFMASLRPRTHTTTSQSSAPCKTVYVNSVFIQMCRFWEFPLLFNNLLIANLQKNFDTSMVKIDRLYGFFATYVFRACVRGAESGLFCHTLILQGGPDEGANTLAVVLDNRLREVVGKVAHTVVLATQTTNRATICH